MDGGCRYCPHDERLSSIRLNDNTPKQMIRKRSCGWRCIAFLAVLLIGPSTKGCCAFVFLPASSSSSPWAVGCRINDRLPDTYTDHSRCHSKLHGSSKHDDGKLDQEVPTYFSPNAPLTDKNTTDDDENGPSSDSASVTNEYSFFDEAVILVRAGSGGQGSSTYKKMSQKQDGPPDGGNGGRGGDVLLVVDESLNTLAGLTTAWRPNSFGGSGAAVVATTASRRKSFRAENGHDGGRQFKNGRYGEEATIRVPKGTIVQEILEDGSLVDMGILPDNQDSLVVATGGEGGEGSGIHKKSRGVKRPRKPPGGGSRRTLLLTLKLVADVALVGVPNAGKSTFLASVTRAKPKIANYPFTTVVPNLGVWAPKSSEVGGGAGLVLCDVPGLISGAAQGVGLGHAFLRHVERCHVILHLVDATSNDPIADYEMLNKEIVRYGSGDLASMPQVVVVNKVDAFDGSGTDSEKGLRAKWTREELESRLKDVMPHSRLMWMSAKEADGVEDLMVRLAAFVGKVKTQP